MAKELPYFKFFVSEWNDGDITLEDYEAQGLFINICSYYWSNECRLKFKKVKKKFKDAKPESFNTLIESDLLKIDDEDNLSISFLNEQQEDRVLQRAKNQANGAKGGRPKKKDESEEKPTGLLDESETEAKQKALREEEIRKEKIRKDEEKKLKSKRFLPPTQEEIKAYCIERKNQVDPNKFFDFYESKGWMVGKNKMKSWKASVRTWEKNSQGSSAQNSDIKHAGKFDHDEKY